MNIAGLKTKKAHFHIQPQSSPKLAFKASSDKLKNYSQFSESSYITLTTNLHKSKIKRLNVWQATSMIQMHAISKHIHKVAGTLHEISLATCKLIK